jgi:signal recognition particle receptor subunit beta
VLGIPLSCYGPGRVSTINQATREIQAKIVYYGPGLSGKTTTLKSIHAAVRPEARGQMVSLATEGDRTLFFDFLPLTVEQVNGLTLRLQLYTVPGQVFYEATRQLVLNGADGVIFVADSQAAAGDANHESLASLERNLKAMGHDPATFPFAIQWNKRDLANALPVSELRAALNPRGAPDFETVAARGTGVMDALKEVTRQVMAGLRARPKPLPPPVVVTRPAPQPPAPPQPPPASPAAAPPPAAPPHPFPTPSVPFPPAPQADAARGTLSFAALFTTPRRAGAGSSFGGPDDEPGAATLAEVENAIRERRFTTAIRTAAQGVSDVLGGLEVIERSDAARAALLGVDGRDYLRLLRLSRLPEGMAGERDALFALHVLIGVRLKADSI